MAPLPPPLKSASDRKKTLSVHLRLSAVAVLAATRAEMWDTRPHDMTVAQGENAMFNCSGSTVGWLLTTLAAPHAVVKIFQSPDEWVDESYRSRFDISGQYNLIVNSADARADAGKYQCNAYESKHFFPAYLVVIGKLNIAISF